MILHTFSLFFSISFETLSSKGPEFPIQVVQPYPTILKPSLFKKTCKPALSKYSLTTLLPGAKDVFTHQGTFKPSSTAFFAIKPDINKTIGFEVFVQLVMAAKQILPLVKVPLSFKNDFLSSLSKEFSYIFGISFKTILS